jgi:hypothetical protein
MIDWKTIETEYVTTDISHRQLAEKYGICRSTISKKATDDKWSEKRDKHRANTVSKTVNAIGTKQAEMAAKLYGVGGLLLDRVKLLLEDKPELLADTSSMKDVSVVLKNLKDLMSVKSDADMREQEARIEKLRREAEPDKGAETPKLIVEGLPEEFKV